MRLLFFSPFSGIWEFATLEGRIAAALAIEGHEIVFITCAGLFHRHCLVMAAQGLPPEATGGGSCGGGGCGGGGCGGGGN